MICITGGIGSGKSVVSRVLRLNGFAVYDCDTEARRLMEENVIVREEIIGILGPEAYVSGDSQGKEVRLNRSFVASEIFNNDKLRNMVNAVVHRAVREDFIRFATLRHGTVFCETAIPVTSRLDRICDHIWIVTAPEEVRIERVKLRNSLSEDEIQKRIATQRDEFESLPKEKLIEIKNGNNDPVLPRIYELTEILNKK